MILSEKHWALRTEYSRKVAGNKVAAIFLPADLWCVSFCMEKCHIARAMMELDSRETTPDAIATDEGA